MQLRKKNQPHACIITESVLVNLGTSLQLLLTQEIVRRQGEDTQEDSLTDTQVRLTSSLCSLRVLFRGRGRTASQKPR